MCAPLSGKPLDEGNPDEAASGEFEYVDVPRALDL